MNTKIRRLALALALLSVSANAGQSLTSDSSVSAVSAAARATTGSASRQSMSSQFVAASSLLGCPEEFDGACLYQQAFQAYLQYHYIEDGVNPNLANPADRQKWAAEWEHKFDQTDAFKTEAGTDSAIRQMRDSLGQRFDYVLSSEGTESEQNRQQAQFGGIGLPISMRNAEKTVLGGEFELVAHTPPSNSPAFNRIRYGDTIVNIGGEPVDGMTIEAALNKLKGMPGTPVKLTVRRTNGKSGTELVNLEITRDYTPMPLSTAALSNEASIGVALELTNADQIKVSNGFEIVAGAPDGDSPAKGKIAEGDYIIKIDGVSVNGMTLNQAFDKVRGAVGSSVTLTVSRPGEEIGSDLIFDVELTRKLIEQHAVHFKDLGNGVAYIKLDQFESQNVPQDMLNAIARAVLPLSSQALASNTDAQSVELVKRFAALEALLDQGGTIDQDAMSTVLAAVQIYDETNAGGGLIIDLRGNPGGDMNVLNLVSGMVLPHGLTMTTVERTPGTDQVVVTENTLTPTIAVKSTRPVGAGLDKMTVTESPRVPLLVPSEMPLVVLVDERSASASELLSGMLQANHRATIVGKSTIGKGVGQSVVQLPYGRSLHVTDFEFFPGGIETDWVGVIVDIEVSAARNTDAPLNTAIDEIDRQNKVRSDREAAGDASRDRHNDFFEEQIEDRAIEDSKPLDQQDPWKLN